MKKDAFYFSHDSNSKDDPKIMLLIDELGLEGYGIFWVLIEELRNQKDYKYPMKLVRVLARRYNTTQAKMETVVSNYELFQFTEDEFFYSDSLMERMQFLDEKRKRRQVAGAKGGKKTQQLKLNSSNASSNATSNTSSTTTSNDKASKVNIKKVKESKVNVNKESKVINEIAYPSFSEFKDYALMKGKKVDIEIDLKKLELKFDSWAENNWINGFGKKIKSWKMTLSNSLTYLEVDLKKSNFSENSEQSNYSKAKGVVEEVIEIYNNSPMATPERIDHFAPEK